MSQMAKSIFFKQTEPNKKNSGLYEKSKIFLIL